MEKASHVVLRVFLIILTFLPLLLAIIFIAVGVKVVDYGNYGLRYNSISSKIMEGGKTYKSGRYFVGMSSEFILFPSKDQIINVDDIHIVNNISSYEIGVSAIYSIPEKNIYDIYSNYGGMNTFQKAMIRVLNHTFSTSASTIDYSCYFENQTDTQILLNDMLTNAWGNMGVDVSQFFVDYVSYASSIENKIITKQIVTLNNTLQSRIREHNEITTQMLMMEKVNEVKIGEIFANAVAEKERYNVMALLDVSNAKANMIACIYNMYTAKEIKDPEPNETNDPNGDSSNNDEIKTYNTSDTNDDNPDADTNNVNQGIELSAEEFVDYIRKKALLSAKPNGTTKPVLELDEYVDL